MGIENAKKRLLDSDNELSYSQRVAIVDLIERLKGEVESYKSYCRYIMEELEDNESVIDTVWVKDYLSCTLFEDIDHTLNQPELPLPKAPEVG